MSRVISHRRRNKAGGKRISTTRTTRTMRIGIPLQRATWSATEVTPYKRFSKLTRRSKPPCCCRMRYADHIIYFSELKRRLDPHLQLHGGIGGLLVGPQQHALLRDGQHAHAACGAAMGADRSSGTHALGAKLQRMPSLPTITYNHSGLHTTALPRTQASSLLQHVAATRQNPLARELQRTDSRAGSALGHVLRPV